MRIYVPKDLGELGQSFSLPPALQTNASSTVAPEKQHTSCGEDSCNYRAQGRVLSGGGRVSFLIWKSDPDLTIVTALKITSQRCRDIMVSTKRICNTCQSSVLSLIGLAFALNSC